MIRSSAAFSLALVLVSLTGATSCSVVKKVGSGSVSMVKKASSATADGIDKLMPGERIKIVEVREGDLQELPTGKDKALAYDRKQEQKRGFLAMRLFRGNSGNVTGNVPVPKLPFKEPGLPADGAELDASLLPPLPN